MAAESLFGLDGRAGCFEVEENGEDACVGTAAVNVLEDAEGANGDSEQNLLFDVLCDDAEKTVLREIAFEATIGFKYAAGESPGWTGTSKATPVRTRWSGAGITSVRWPLRPPPRVEWMTRALAWSCFEASECSRCWAFRRWGSEQDGGGQGQTTSWLLGRS
jgi:hypothetical protein